jgi:hypothetical protein
MLDQFNDFPEDLQGETEPEADKSEMRPPQNINVVASNFITGSDVEIGEHLKEYLNTKFGEIAYCEGKFWCYAVTQWKEIPRTDLWIAVAQYDGHTHGKKNSIIRLGKTRIESVLNHLEKICHRPGFFKDAARGVNCLSGFVEFAADGTPSLEPHCEWHRQRHTLQARWSPGLSIPAVSLLYTLLHGSLAGDPEKEQKLEVLARLAGSVVTGSGTRGTNPRAFVFKGESKAGKGQLLTVFRGLVPQDAQSAVAPGQFGKPDYLAKLAGKLLNTYDELGTTYAITAEVFKAVITGDPITACLKYANAFTFTPAAQHIFACNMLPGFRGGMDQAVLNRLFILQFDHVIPVEERIEDLGKRIVAEEMELLLAWAIDGASRLIREKGFPKLESAEAELAEWSESDPVVSWIRERLEQVTLGTVGDDGSVDPVCLAVNEMYSDFRTVAEADGHPKSSIPSKKVFSQRLRSAGLKRGRNNRFRGFVGVRFKETSARHERMAGRAAAA